MPAGPPRLRSGCERARPGWCSCPSRSPRSGRHRPPAVTLAGAVVATGGLFFVLDLTGASDLDPVGVAWALGAAVCLACYFAFSAHGGGDGLPALAFTAIGLLVGAAT